MIAQRLPNAGAAAEACARRVTGLLETALEGGEIASFAVSGGSTPRLLFEKLVTLRFDWSRVHLFWETNAVCRLPILPAITGWPRIG
jgi:6-phosphogluconolactonase